MKPFRHSTDEDCRLLEAYPRQAHGRNTVRMSAFPYWKQRRSAPQFHSLQSSPCRERTLSVKVPISVTSLTQVASLVLSGSLKSSRWRGSRKLLVMGAVSHITGPTSGFLHDDAVLLRLEMRIKTPRNETCQVTENGRKTTCEVGQHEEMLLQKANVF